MSLQLSPLWLKRLSHAGNLLAYSGGSDSSALYHLLHAAKIPFDIAIVHHHVRAQADAECAHALLLAQKDGRRCFVHDAPCSASNFEHHARTQRYAFFESLIRTHGYTHLLLAHHLNDALEWLLMQLCKGAGVYELAGMNPYEAREGYLLARPLLECAKSEIEHYLFTHAIPHFHDSSNDDPSIVRNHFRALLDSPYLQAHTQGIARSFAYLREDAAVLCPLEHIQRFGALYKINRPAQDSIALRLVHYACKQLGVVPSRHQRAHLLHPKGCILSQKVAIAQSESHLWVAPYASAIMPKPFRERCRRVGIPPKIRGYLFASGIAPESLF